MSTFFKKIVATLTGSKEQAPDRTAAMEQYRRQTTEEANLARERQQAQQQAMRERMQKEESVEEVEVPIDDDNIAA